MQNFWNIAMVFAGTVIGAGFASGQEVVQYFIKYGENGIFGILLSVALFTVFAAVVLCKISITKANDAGEYIGEAAPVFIRKLYVVLSVSFMFITFCTMVSATGEMFAEHLNLPDFAGITAMYIICFVAFKKGESGMVGVNKVLTPLIIIVTVIVFAKAFLTRTEAAFNAEKIFYNTVTSSMVYVSYNTLSIIAVFTAVSSIVSNRTTAVLGALTGGLLLLVTSLCLWYVLVTAGVTAAKIPMLAALDGVMKLLYMPVLFFAMLTTAVSCGFGVIKSLKIKREVAIAGLFVFSYLISRLGFVKLVSNIYAVFGYVGFVTGIYTIYDGKKYLKG